METISVLMSVYNVEFRIFDESIRSILSQTYKNFELIIVLDGDYSHENYLKSLNDDRIVILKNHTNMGLAYSMNLALENSVGEFIFRADADDVCVPDRFDRQIVMLNKGHYIVSSRCLEISYEGQPLNKTRMYIFHNATMRFLLYFLNLNPVIHSSIAARRIVFDKYKYDNTYRRRQDFELWLRIKKDFKIYFMRDVLVYYRTKK